MVIVSDTVTAKWQTAFALWRWRRLGRECYLQFPRGGYRLTIYSWCLELTLLFPLQRCPSAV